MDTKGYLVVDIETTGFIKFDANGTLIPDFLEFGYLVLDDSGRITDSGAIYFYEDWFDIENEAQNFHKLTREFLKENRVDTQDGICAMLTLCAGRILIGKNIQSFDINFLRRWCQKYGIVDVLVDTPIYDVQTAYAPIYRKKAGLEGTSKRGSLEDYIKVNNDYQIVEDIYTDLPKKRVTQAHGALYDCVMTYVAFLYCMTEAD